MKDSGGSESRCESCGDQELSLSYLLLRVDGPQSSSWSLGVSDLLEELSPLGGASARSQMVQKPSALRPGLFLATSEDLQRHLQRRSGCGVAFLLRRGAPVCSDHLTESKRPLTV